MRFVYPSINKNHLKIYLLLRFLIITLIGSIGCILYLKHKWSYPEVDFTYFSLWLIFVYLMSVVFWILWQRDKINFLTYFVITLAPFSVTTLIYFTGGANSFFSILYIFVIIAAAFFFRKRGALIMAAVSWILYGGLIDLEYFGIIPPIGEKPGGDILFTLLINFGAFFAIAFLSSFLLEKLERSEKELQFLETLYKSVLESIQTGVVTVDKENRILYMNPAAEFISGHKAKFLRGQPVEKLFPHINNISPQRTEFSFVRPDGKVVYLGLSLSSLVNENGQYAGKVFVFQDLTNLKRVEKLSLLGELAAHMAHEIRTPLTSISGCMQMLQKESNISSDMKVLMDLALKETKRLNLLISDFLSYARPIKKKAKLNLTSLIEDTVTLFKAGIKDQNIDIETQLLPEVYVRGSKEDLKRLFLNLFTNAKEAMPKGGKMTVTMEIIGNMIKVSISDTGIGIPSDIQERIFEPFFTTKSQGSGLGLAIAHKIISEHEGKIELVSKLGEGSSFKIYLPLISAPRSLHAR